MPHQTEPSANNALGNLLRGMLGKAEGDLGYPEPVGDPSDLANFSNQKLSFNSNPSNSSRMTSMAVTEAISHESI